MQIEETFIEGLKVIHLNKFSDQRGDFIKVFNQSFFSENLLDTDIKESYFSVSHKGVIRGMHFQIPPFDHTKLVYVNTGSILDVVLDIRKSSKTYGRYFTIDLKANSPQLIYIPKGLAHGFLSKENNTMVTYMQTTGYNQECDKGIKYDSFDFDWPANKPVLSQRDTDFIDFKDFISPF